MSFATSFPRGAVRKRPAGFGGAARPKARRGVDRSAELARVINLSRRPEGGYDQAFADAMSLELVRPGSDFRLKPKQAAMLVEAVEAGGLFSTAGVGGGKTVAAPLFGHIMDIAPTLMLVPPSIKTEITTRVIPWLLRNIDFIPPMVVSYSELSTASKSDLLDRIKPRLIIADECHNLRNTTASRTKRFLRYFAENPDTLLVALSGTVTRRSVMDFWRIIQLTHRGWRLPITRHWREAKDWSLALDPQVPADQRLAPGALLELCRPGEEARDGFRRRLLETDGVIGGSAEDVGASLTVRKISPGPVPASVLAALDGLRGKWETPGGEQVTDALDFVRKARELAQGFYYVWDWPGGEPDKEWLEARAAWRKAVAEVCKLNREGLDSELLVRNAAARAAGQRDAAGLVARSDAASLPKAKRESVVDAWLAWEEVRTREEPPVRAVWVDDFLVRAAIGWARKAEADGNGGLVWYDARAIEERLNVLRGGLVCGAGTDGNARLLELSSADREGSAPSVFLSAHAHGTGKNLQRWSANLILAPFSGGATYEQLIGRTHRPGQDADEVTVDMFVHTPELEKSIETAMEQSRYIFGVTGGAQKLLIATWVEARR